MDSFPDASNLLSLYTVFILLFVTLGPIKVFGPFVQLTHDADEARTKKIAVRAFALATIAAVVGGFVGELLVENWHISAAALTLVATAMAYFWLPETVHRASAGTGMPFRNLAAMMQRPGLRRRVDRHRMKTHFLHRSAIDPAAHGLCHHLRAKADAKRGPVRFKSQGEPAKLAGDPRMLLLLIDGHWPAHHDQQVRFAKIER